MSSLLVLPSGGGGGGGDSATPSTDGIPFKCSMSMGPVAGQHISKGQARQMNIGESYLNEWEVLNLFESLATALMYERPPNPYHFVQTCMKRAVELDNAGQKPKAGDPQREWHSFVSTKRLKQCYKLGPGNTQQPIPRQKSNMGVMGTRDLASGAPHPSTFDRSSSSTRHTKSSSSSSRSGGVGGTAGQIKKKKSKLSDKASGKLVRRPPKMGDRNAASGSTSSSGGNTKDRPGAANSASSGAGSNQATSRGGKERGKDRENSKKPIKKILSPIPGSRSSTSVMLTGDTDKDKAATTIQTNFRGYSARKELKAKNDAATTIQANVRPPPPL